MEKWLRPLTQLQKKGNFVQTEASTVAMQQLRRALTTAPVLSLLNLSQTFCIWMWCVREGSGCGVVTKQEAHCIFQQGPSWFILNQIHIQEGINGSSVGHTTLEALFVGKEVQGVTDKISLCYRLEQRITTQPTKLVAKAVGARVWDRVQTRDIKQGCWRFV